MRGIILTLLAASAPEMPAAHSVRDVEGWTVRVDDRLLAGPDAGLGARAVKLLAARLYEVTLVVPADKLARLRKVPIVLDKSHGRLTSMQYHTSRGWLRQNGYAADLVKCVHIPVAALFADPRHHHQQPWAVLHELAHAYHDQVLGFENAEVKAAWVRFKDAGKFAEVPHIDGRPRKHYALTNQMEFFAEMTEAYFGLNDFYPYHRADLRAATPDVYDLMRKVWGPTP